MLHEFRPGTGQHHAEQSAGERDEERYRYVGEIAAEDERVLVAEKAEQGEEVGLAARIDDMVGASQQLVDVGGVGAGGRILAQSRQVRGHLAIEQSQLLEFGAGKLSDARGIGLAEERLETIPQRAAAGKPQVGKDSSHGPGVRSA